MKFDLLLKNGEIVLPGEGVCSGSIGIVGEKIAAIMEPGAKAQADRLIDCTDRWIMPGLLDPHTHIGFGANELDFGTEARSAALGGVTGLLSFFRSDDLAAGTGPWRTEGETRSLIDFGFHYGVTKRDDVDMLSSLAERFGITSIKVYLMYKGAYGASKGFTEVDDALLFWALQAGARLGNGVVGVHCENVEVIPVFREPLQEAGRNDLKAWDEQSPGFLETENIFRVCFFGEKAGCPVNIVHMSAGESLEVVERLRHEGRPPIHVETCAHYLSLSHDAPVGLLGKVNPPLRSQNDIDALWEGVRRGSISTIGSDHVPRKRSTKGPDLWKASAGFPGLATLLPVLIEEGWHKRSVPIETLAGATSRNVARLYSLPNKGVIAPGYDADFAIVDPDREVKVDPGRLESHSDYSPYEHMTFRGAVDATIRRGAVIMQHGAVTQDEAPGGRYLFRRPELD